MKDYFSYLLSPNKWLIKEDGWDPKLQGVRETQFTLGNGFICTRGVLEEIPYDAYPGTYMAGIYDKTTAQVPEIVNLPNPVNFKIICNGEKLDIGAMDVLKHERILDMGKGLLVRKTLYSNSKKERLLYQSMRFITMHDKNIGAIQIYLTALDASTDITIVAGADTSITNRGVLTEGRKRHFRVVEMKEDYICIEIFESKKKIVYQTELYALNKDKIRLIPREAHSFHLRKGRTISFILVFSISLNTQNSKMPRVSFNKLLKRHIDTWEKKWDTANVEINGDPDIDKAMRFNIYHMLIATPYNGNSVGARTLSGEGYRGHIFWDAEIFLMPFYLYTNPQASKSMLMYRNNRLNPARQIAKQKGYKGAMFPWESADTGFESTPTWFKDLDGSIIRIYTMEMEHHITADIAYGVNQYWIATGDIEFMLRYGLEIMFETARFWRSRVSGNSIKHVIGPDEFHINVNNNAYTNIMAKWNLKTASLLYDELIKKYPREVSRTLKRINLSRKEIDRWDEAAEKILIPKRDKLIEAFSGYFKKKEFRITSLDNNLMPVFPKGMLLSKIGQTKLVKQADVVMLLHLLSGLFDFETKKINYEYYNKRSLHKSSLSPSIYAAVGAEIGDITRAYQYFTVSCLADLNDMHGNTNEGIHAASCGGTWQALIMGFCGMHIKNGVIGFNPRLPKHWKSVRFKIIWKSGVKSIFLRRRYG